MKKIYRLTGKREPFLDAIILDGKFNICVTEFNISTEVIKIN